MRLCGSFHRRLSYNWAKYKDAQGMQVSGIWKLLKATSERAPNGARAGAETEGTGQIPERRSGARFWIYAPVLIYGRAIDSEPFHESTEALRVNAGGGLITLTIPVQRGQQLWLINKANQKERECLVVAERSRYLGRTAVVIGFQELAPDFWSAPSC